MARLFAVIMLCITGKRRHKLTYLPFSHFLLSSIKASVSAQQNDNSGLLQNQAGLIQQFLPLQLASSFAEALSSYLPGIQPGISPLDQLQQVRNTFVEGARPFVEAFPEAARNFIPKPQDFLAKEKLEELVNKFETSVMEVVELPFGLNG